MLAGAKRDQVPRHSSVEYPAQRIERIADRAAGQTAQVKVIHERLNVAAAHVRQSPVPELWEYMPLEDATVAADHGRHVPLTFPIEDVATAGARNELGSCLPDRDVSRLDVRPSADRSEGVHTPVSSCRERGKPGARHAPVRSAHFPAVARRAVAATPIVGAAGLAVVLLDALRRPRSTVRVAHGAMPPWAKPPAVSAARGRFGSTAPSLPQALLSSHRRRWSKSHT